MSKSESVGPSEKKSGELAKIEECFEKAYADKDIIFLSPTVNEYSVEILVQNAIVRSNAESQIKRWFGGLNLKVETIHGTATTKIKIPRVAIPQRLSGIDHFRFLKKHIHNGVWLGVSEFGPEYMDFDKVVHMAVTGSSGYGKTSFVRAVIGQLAFLSQGIRLAIIDPKGGTDYQFLERSPKVISVAKTLNDWISLLSGLVIELAAREYLYSEIAAIPPATFGEYVANLHKDDSKCELPKLERIVVCIDEAFMVLRNGPFAEHLIEFLARKGRAYGIHLFFSMQRPADVTSGIRAQVNSWMTFYSPEPNHSWAHDGLMCKALDQKRAIPGRGLRIDIEEADVTEIQTPYFSMRDVLGLALEAKSSLPGSGLMPIGVSQDLLDNGILARKILEGNSLKDLAQSNILLDDRHSRFIGENFKCSVRLHPRMGPTRSASGDHPSATQLILPQFEKVDNSPTAIELSERAARAEADSNDSLHWARRDLSANPGIKACMRLADTNKSSKNAVVLDELILDAKIKSKIWNYCEEIRKAFSNGDAPPVLVIIGEKGSGKATLLESIAKHANAKCTIGKISSDESIDKGKISEKQIQIFDDVNNLKSCFQKYRNAALSLVVDCEDGDEEIESILSAIRKLGVHFYFVHLSSTSFLEPKIVAQFISRFLKQEKYVGDQLLSVADLLSAQIRPSPSTILALVKRAAHWANAKSLPFDKNALDAVLNEERQIFLLGKNGPVDVVRPTKSLSDLVVNAASRRKIELAIDGIGTLNAFTHSFESRLRRKANYCILAGGPPGVGKSLLAEVIAFETRRPLWICDFGRVQSCYVGQTEAILSRLFEMAEAAGSILLLDECDSLLRTRSENLSNYARIVTSHLLTLIDNFGGVLVLTTNFAGSLDPAISRRCAIKLDFAPPDQQTMAVILRKMLEPDAPMEPDFDYYAVFEGVNLTGGLIRNAVERAVAMMKLTKADRLTMDILRSAILSIHEENEIVVGRPQRTISLTSLGMSS